MGPACPAFAASLCAVLLGPSAALSRTSSAVQPGEEHLLAPQGTQGQQRRAAQFHQLQERAAPLVDTLISWQANVTIIDIGACDGDSVGRDPVQSALAEHGVRAVLVEPNAPIFKRLKERMAETFGNTPRIQFIEAAVAANSSGSTPFYVVSPTLEKDFPAVPSYMVREISSMSYDHVLKHHAEGGLTEEELKPYIQELCVPTLAPMQLLRAAGLAPGEVDVLKVDAEGYDAEIVHAFLDVPGFAAKVIIFEVLHLQRRPHKRLMHRLEDEGYSFDCPQTRGCAVNVVAFKTSFFS